MELEYTFEKMLGGRYQVRLQGEFICYTDKQDSKYVDDILKEVGFNSREEYLNYRFENFHL